MLPNCNALTDKECKVEAFVQAFMTQPWPQPGAVRNSNEGCEFPAPLLRRPNLYIPGEGSFRPAEPGQWQFQKLVFHHRCGKE